MPGSHVPQIETLDGVTVVTFGAEFDQITEDRIPGLIESLLAAVDGPRPLLLVDLSQVQFFGSSFIEVLFRAWKRVQEKPDGRFALCGLTPNCAEVIEVSNLNKVWDVYPTRETALSAMQSTE